MAKKKRKHLVRSKSIRMRWQRPVAIGVIAIALLSLAFMAHAAAVKHPTTRKAATVTSPTPEQESAAPKPPTLTSSTTTTSKSSPSQTTTTIKKSSSVATIPQSAKPEPVVTPSPSSSVSSLAPVTTSSSTGGSSSTTGSGGSSTGQASTPATTTGYTSTNWSGYLAATGHFTAITGSWTVPSVAGPSGETSADSAWIGIGGVSTSDLIQTGTQDTVSPNGQVSSSAFYELLPASSVNIPSITVSAGDHMTASLTELSSNEWTISITDLSNDESYTMNTAYDSSNSSAEWIEEDPSYSFRRQAPFDNFGTVTFNDGTTTTNGSTVSITNSSAEPVTMVDSSETPVATPSALSGGNFSVTRDE